MKINSQAVWIGTGAVAVACLLLPVVDEFVFCYGMPQGDENVYRQDESQTVDNNKAIPGPDRSFRFMYPVMYNPANPIDEKVALKLSGLIRSPFGDPQPQDRSPGCAFWVENDPLSRLNPPSEGYLIRILPGGGMFWYSSESQAEKALSHLERVIISDNGNALVPEGILTNYPLIVSDLINIE